MTKFEDQLFDDLMRDHGPALAHARPPAAPKRHITVRRTVLAAGAGCAAVGVIAGTLVADGGSPAYAVTKNPDGTVTLAVYTKSGIAGANARLRDLGDDQVVVVPTGPGCPPMSSLPAPAVPLNGQLRVQVGRDVRGDSGSVTVNAQGIPAGDILVVAVESTANGPATSTLGASRLTSPPTPACVSLPAGPPLPPGGSGSKHGSRVTVSGIG